MILKKNSYYISPFEKKAFTGKFFLWFIGTSDKITFNGDIIETPRSVGDIDLLFTGEKINRVRVNTTYKQPLIPI